MTDDGFDVDELRTLLVDQHGWTMLTAVNLMLFSLLHNPCATTIMTIYKETLSAQLGHARRADAAGRGVPRDVRDGDDRPAAWLGVASAAIRGADRAIPASLNPSLRSRHLLHRPQCIPA